MKEKNSCFLIISLYFPNIHAEKQRKFCEIRQKNCSIDDLLVYIFATVLRDLLSFEVVWLLIMINLVDIVFKLIYFINK